MSDAAAHDPATCRSCPVCMVLHAVRDVRPEVAAHLAAAGRELVLALHAAMAADSDSGPAEPESTIQRADDSAQPRAGTPRLRRIAID